MKTFYSSESDSECELISVKTPSQQWVERAMELQLPTYFYNYLDSPGCIGCSGCDPDSFDFSKIGKRVPEDAPRSKYFEFFYVCVVDVMLCYCPLPVFSHYFLYDSLPFLVCGYFLKSQSLSLSD